MFICHKTETVKIDRNIYCRKTLNVISIIYWAWVKFYVFFLTDDKARNYFTHRAISNP